MKKNELVHLHSLLVRIAADYLERGLMTEADLEPYRDVGVGPSSLTEPRSEHRRAVRALLSVLAERSDSDAGGDGEARSEPQQEPERPTGNH